MRRGGLFRCRGLIFGSEIMRSVPHWIWLGAHLVLFIGFSHFSFSRNYGNLAIGEDGGAHLIDAIQQWTWAPAALGFYSDPFQGMSDLWPGPNNKLILGYVLPMLFLGNGDAISPQYIILSYVVFSTEMFLSVLVLARAIGTSWTVSVISAWALPMLAQPLFGSSLLYPILMMAPSVGTMIAEFSLLAAAIN